MAPFPSVSAQYILEHLDSALEQQHIQVYFQPVIRTVSRQMCSMEALARWIDPQYGLLPPPVFIPVLEQHGLIHLLDCHVIWQVCALYREAVSRGDIVVPISLNLSRLDFELCDIFSVVEEAVRTYEVPRQNICIEITESALTDNENSMIVRIDRFRNAGYQVWMDDFGCGYSSLNTLKDFEFDELKIDMHFLSDFRLRSKRILASIVHMAKQINIQTLAEGVETEEQFNFLRDIGCEKVQGYLFGRPMPYAQCIANITQKGMTLESPAHRHYYDELGKLDLLSATPFLSREERDAITSGRAMNSTPMAVLEIMADTFRFLFTNDAFDETVSSADWTTFDNVLERIFSGDSSQGMDWLPPRLRSLLEDTRNHGRGKMYFVTGGEYFEMSTKLLAARKGAWSFLLRLDNLSRGMELEQQSTLDKSLRHIYAIFNRVTQIDLNNHTVQPLYMDAQQISAATLSSIESAVRAYSNEYVFPEDREDFLHFMNEETMDERVRSSTSHYVSAHFRTRTQSGNYVWTHYALVNIRAGVFILLVRENEAEVRRFWNYQATQNNRFSMPEGEELLPPELLWGNLTRNGRLKLFWKDRERRFMGASQSFLDFYGFPSVKHILGKTDEDLGWHIHPDLYRSDEEDVIEFGEYTWNVPGNCIVHGTNRSIVASKMPVYDSYGKIAGLLGFFSESSELKPEKNMEHGLTRTDLLTGVLNARGLTETLSTYRDEYDLRRTNFVRVDLTVDDFADMSRLYGYDYTDHLIVAISKDLLREFGQFASVCRVSGCDFVILSQFQHQKELQQLLDRVRQLPSRVREVDGIPCTLYISVGASIYSETEDVERQAQQARLRIKSDHAEIANSVATRQNVAGMFRMYDALPVAYAVYKVHLDAVTKVSDATMLYVNQRFCELVDMSNDTLVGSKVRPLFPTLTPDWYDYAYRSAILGEKVVAHGYYPEAKSELNITVNQVISPGYCAFTYIVPEDFDAEEMGAGPAKG